MRRLDSDKKNWCAWKIFGTNLQNDKWHLTQINDFGNAETVTRPDKRNEMIWIDMKRFNDHTNYRDKKKLEPHNIRGENRISFFFLKFWLVCRTRKDWIYVTYFDCILMFCWIWVGSATDSINELITTNRHSYYRQFHLKLFVFSYHWDMVKTHTVVNIEWIWMEPTVLWFSKRIFLRNIAWIPVHSGIDNLILLCVYRDGSTSLMETLNLSVFI